MTSTRLATATTPAFGSMLRRHRLAAGLTQDELAERAHISQRTISDLERGVPHRPRPETLALLAEALALSSQECHAFIEAARRLGAQTPPRPLPPDSLELPSFAGRAGELALLQRHLSGEGPPLLLLAGEPGIGKSRLLRAAHALSAGYAVLEGGCQRRGGHAPYAPLLEALQGHLRRRHPAALRRELEGCAWLVRLLPELAAGPIEPLLAWTLAPIQERRLMGEAVARLLANAAGPAGTLLLLDDLQWADPDALDLLVTLVRSADEIPLRVVVAYRDTEVQPQDVLSVTLADLAQAGLATQRFLGPLAPAEAADLLEGLLQGLEQASTTLADGARLRESVLQRAGGVPFFLVSYAQALRMRAGAEGAAADGDPVADLPWDVAQGLRQRVAALPAAAREVLDVAAVVGRQAARALLVRVTAQPERAVLDAVEAACRARLLEEAGVHAYRFAHDVIREVVEADLGAGRRTLLHREIAVALEAEPGVLPADVLAYHYARGDVPEKAVFYLAQAGDHARTQYAHAAAADYYRELVELLERLGRALDAAYAREKLGTVLSIMARYDAALAQLELAAGAYQAAGDLEGLQRTMAAIGQAHAHRGTPEEGLQRLQPLVDPQAVKAMEQSAGPGLAALYVALAHLYFMSGRYPQELEAAERAADLARTVGDERLLAAAAFERGMALTERSDAEALAALAEASRLAEAVGDLDTLCSALDLMGCIYENGGAFGLARQYTERALAVAERQGDPALLVYLMTRRGMGAYLSGEWSQAYADYAQALALSRKIGDSWAAAFPLHDLGRLCLAEGAWAEAAAYLEESCALSTHSGNLVPLRWAQLVLAERDVLDGHPGAARARLMPLLDRPGLEEQQVVFLLPMLAWAHLEEGDVDQAAAVVEQGVRRARNGEYLRALVEALRVQALVCTRQRRWAQAADSIEEGLSLTRCMPFPYAEARFLQAYGLLQAAQGEPVPACERLEQALTLFNRLGAHKDAEAVEQARERLQPPRG